MSVKRRFNRKFIKTLDYLVGILVGASTVLTCLMAVCVSTGSEGSGVTASIEYILYKSPILPVCAVTTCLAIGAWAFLGNGLNSVLWEWLPPFCFFNHFDSRWRAFLLALLILGTLISMIGEFLGNIARR